MDDLDRTYDKLKKLDIFSLEERICNFRNTTYEQVWIEEDGDPSGRLYLNPKYREIIEGNGWTVEDWMNRINPNRKNNG
jgi:hypothetical protein